MIGFQVTWCPDIFITSFILPLNRQSKQKIPTNCLFVYFFAFFRESDVISRIAGLLSWDVASCHVDLGKELDIITSVAPPGEECRGGTYIFYVYWFYVCFFKLKRRKIFLIFTGYELRSELQEWLGKFGKVFTSKNFAIEIFCF